MSIKQKAIYDAGAVKPVNKFEINDLSGKLTSVPKSPYAITESFDLAITSNIAGNNNKNIDISSGERRPGTMR